MTDVVPAPTPATQPDRDDAAFASQAHTYIAEYVPDLIGTKGEDLVRRAMLEGNPPAMISLVVTRIPGGESLGTIPIARYSRDFIASQFGPGGYSFNVRGRRGFKGSFQESIDSSYLPSTPTAQPMQRPQPHQAAPSRDDQLIAVLGQLARRLDVIEARQVQPVQPPPVIQQQSTTMVDAIKEMAIVMQTLQGLQPKSDGLAAEMERFERIAKFIDVKASGRSLAEATAEEEEGAVAGIVGKLVDFAGPKLPRLLDALAARIDGGGKPVGASPSPKAPPGRRVVEPPAPPRQLPPRANDVSDDEFFKNPYPLGSAKAMAYEETREPLNTGADGIAEELIREIAPSYPPDQAIEALAQGIETGGPVMLVEMLNAHRETLIPVLARYTPGDITFKLSRHSRLNAFAQIIADVEMQLRNQLGDVTETSTPTVFEDDEGDE